LPGCSFWPLHLTAPHSFVCADSAPLLLSSSCSRRLPGECVAVRQSERSGVADERRHDGHGAGLQCHSRRSALPRILSRAAVAVPRAHAQMLQSQNARSDNCSRWRRRSAQRDTSERQTGSKGAANKLVAEEKGHLSRPACRAMLTFFCAPSSTLLFMAAFFVAAPAPASAPASTSASACRSVSLVQCAPTTFSSAR